MGPLINEVAVLEAERHVTGAVSRGARLVIGGSRLSPGPGLTDRFFAPMLLAEVADSMDVCREETFGAVLAVGSFADLEEAVLAANRSPHGLAAYVAGRDAATVTRVAEDL